MKNHDITNMNTNGLLPQPPAGCSGTSGPPNDLLCSGGLGFLFEEDGDMQFIRPYRAFIAFQTPNWLARRTEVSCAAKLVYGRLCQYAGDKDECFPSQQTIGIELGLTARSVRSALAELVSHGLIVKQQRGFNKTNVYRFPFHKWMAFRASVTSAPDVPNTSAPDVPFTSAHELPNTSALRESGEVESGEENHSREPLAKARFTKPNLEELRPYVKERGMPSVEAEKFLDFYESKGWRVGGNPMKDWRAAVRNWERRWRERNPQIPKPKSDWLMGNEELAMPEGK